MSLPKVGVYSGSNDGYRGMTGDAWDKVRGLAVGGTALGSVTSTGTGYSGCRASLTTGRGATTYYLYRSFFEFDTSSITDLPSTATLSLYQHTNDNSGFRFVKSTQDSSLSSDDFNEIPGLFPASSNGVGGDDARNNVTAYTDTTTTSMNSGSYTVISLNQQALVDIVGMSTFKFAMVDWENDMRDSIPTAPAGTSNYTGVYYSEWTGTSRDPFLSITTQSNSVFFGTNF